MTDKQGTSFEGIALSVAVIAVGFVASADMLDYMTRTHAHPATVTAAAASIQSKDIDYTPTASLPKLITRSVLDPCNGTVHR